MAQAYDLPNTVFYMLVVARLDLMFDTGPIRPQYHASTWVMVILQPVSTTVQNNETLNINSTNVMKNATELKGNKKFERIKRLFTNEYNSMGLYTKACITQKS